MPRDAYALRYVHGHAPGCYACEIEQCAFHSRLERVEGVMGFTKESIMDWQRRLFSGPKIWMVQDPDGVVGNVYDSKEAAELEIAWRKKRRHRGYRAVSQSIHTVELSRERWGE